MSSDSHLILIVEDHPATAAELASYVASLGMRSRIVSTLDEIDGVLAEGGICGALLDKQLPSEKEATPLAATGDTVLRKLRAYDPRRNAHDHHLFGIIVVTGVPMTDARINDNHRLGATAYVAKPTNADRIAAEVLGALDRAGRSDHADCAAIEGSRPPDRRPASKPSPADTLPLVLDGIRIRRRTSFTFAGKRCDLADSYFLVVLRLAAVRAQGSERAVSKSDLGILRTPEVPSRIRDELAAALPPDFGLIQRLENGDYRLHPLVSVAPIDWDKFEGHTHPGISAFAAGQKKLR